MTYPGLIFWALALYGVFARGPMIYGLFFVSWSFGTLAMIPPQIIGASIFPAWVIAGFLTVRTLLDVGPRAYFGALFDVRRFGLLALCTLYALLSAVLLPRLFAGQIDVITMRLETFGATDLQPSVSNFIQATYFLLTTLTVVNIYFAARDPAKRPALLKGFAWGAAAAVLTGLADMVTAAAGLGGLLQPYRNALYALLVDNEVGDMKRVIGLTSEASAYAALCIGFLSPLAMTPQDRASAPWGRWRVPLALALLAMTYLSTSSGGYVALAFLALVVLAGVGAGLLGGRRPAWLAAYWAVVLAALALGVAVFLPQLVDSLGRMIDMVVIHKAQTASYVERSMWNQMAYAAFLQSHGLGAGIGCCRTSSWIFAVLGNIGAPGALLMSAFMAQVFLSRAADPGERALLRIVKLAILPCLFVISLTSPSVGFGLASAWLFGLAMALAHPLGAPARLRPVLAPLSIVPSFGFVQLTMLDRRQRR